MSEKKAEKLMYAIGGVSEEMLKEAEDYSENLKKLSFRRKRLKKYAKTVFAVGTAAAVIGCALLVYEKPKKSYKNELSSTGKTVEKNYDKSKNDDSMDESETFKYASENIHIHIYNPEITEEEIQDSDGTRTSVLQDIAAGYDENVSDTQKNKKSGTEDGVSADYDKTEEKNSGSAKSGDNCADGTEIRTNKKQKLKVHATKDGETTKIQFILQFGKAGDGGTYICNVKETNAGMSIEKTVLSDKDSNWKENKKAKVVCKSGTKLMFTANITKKQQSEKDIKLLEINVKFKEKGDKTTDGFNMTVRKENDGYYSYMKK